MSIIATLFGEVEAPRQPRRETAEPTAPVEGPFAGVALEQGIDRALDYAIPRGLAASLRVGQRVRVPLGKSNRPAHGYVVSIHPTTDHPRIKPLLEIDDARVLIPPKLMELARWMSRYYVTPLGSVLETVIPSAVKRKVGIGYQQMVRLIPPREQVQEILEKTRAPKRRAILARLLLLEPGEAIDLVRLAGESGVTPATVRKLVRLALVTITPEVDLPRLTADIQPSAGDEADIALNEDQQKVFDALRPRLVPRPAQNEANDVDERAPSPSTSRLSVQNEPNGSQDQPAGVPWAGDSLPVFPSSRAPAPNEANRPPSPGTPGEGRGEGLRLDSGAGFSLPPYAQAKACTTSVDGGTLTLTLSRSTGRGDQTGAEPPGQNEANELGCPSAAVSSRAPAQNEANAPPSPGTPGEGGGEGLPSAFDVRRSMFGVRPDEEGEHRTPNIEHRTPNAEGPPGPHAPAQNEPNPDAAPPSPTSPAGFSVNLILGVTGSGKTEVYLQCIREVVRRGRQAIVLVPEIALTPQTVRRFTARFKRVAILHSGLTATERHRYWQMIANGHAQVVVGARSAVFAPLPDLGVIVVDEEHEASYKQDTAPRYHGRDVAIKRGQIERVPVLLGSATPSLETYAKVVGKGEEARRHAGTEARRGEGGSGAVPAPFPRVPLGLSVSTTNDDYVRPASAPQALLPASHPSVAPSLRRSVASSSYHLLTLPRRVRGLSMPHVELVDMKQENRFRRGVNLLSQRLEHLLRTTVESGHQAILLLNRRGYSNFVHCSSCNDVIQCKYCDATMTYHRSGGPHELSASNAASVHTGQLHCHYCLAVNPLPSKCPTCGKLLSLFGLGTQRVEEEVAKKFPDLRFARVDGDTMRGGKDYEALLNRFAKGEVQVMLGTQMIAKGLDYPNVTLVGVISGDTALALPDFRAAERTFQLITQVAGRAGRGDNPGRVVLQTFLPDDPTIRAAIRQDFAGFAGTELATRREVGLPPFARMVRVVLRDQDEKRLGKTSEELAAKLADAADAEGGTVSMKGPMPCAISRIAGYYRNQIVMLAATPGPLQRVLAKVREKGSLAKTDKIAVDVDPVSLL